MQFHIEGVAEILLGAAECESAGAVGGLTVHIGLERFGGLGAGGILDDAGDGDVRPREGGGPALDDGVEAGDLVGKDEQPALRDPGGQRVVDLGVGGAGGQDEALVGDVS